MVERLIWTHTARTSRKEILEYWIKRNKSKLYSKKLNALFDYSAEQILKFPYSGIQSAENQYRGILIKDYYIIFKVTETAVEIHLIWDTRQDPEKLLEFFKTIHE